MTALELKDLYLPIAGQVTMLLIGWAIIVSLVTGFSKMTVTKLETKEIKNDTVSN